MRTSGADPLLSRDTGGRVGEHPIRPGRETGEAGAEARVDRFIPGKQCRRTVQMALSG